ncbi:MAG: hypothetical protein IPN71_01565 [Fibrobacteres bacterium]|jgi:hypothetical protein|nr:hypothetical protein [Fibrobacterota bacterium]
MKTEDPILEEVRAARVSVLSKAGSFDELVKLLQEQEAARPGHVVTGKPLSPVVIPEAA